MGANCSLQARLAPVLHPYSRRPWQSGKITQK